MISTYQRGSFVTHHHNTDLEGHAWKLFNAEKWDEALSEFTEVLRRDAASEGGLQGKIEEFDLISSLPKIEDTPQERTPVEAARVLPHQTLSTKSFLLAHSPIQHTQSPWF